MLRVGAVYAPLSKDLPRDKAATAGEERISETHGPELLGSCVEGVLEQEKDGPNTTDALSCCVLCQAERASNQYRAVVACSGEVGSVHRIQPQSPEGCDLLSPSDPNAETVHHEKARRARVASCLSALNGMRTEGGTFSESVQQAHFQVRGNMVLCRIPNVFDALPRYTPPLAWSACHVVYAKPRAFNLTWISISMAY